MKPIFIMKIRGIALGCLATLGCLSMHAEDEVPDPNSFIHNDVKYSIEEQWVNPTALKKLWEDYKGFASNEQLFQFFVKDGLIYFCAEYDKGLGGKNNTELLVVDAADGSSATLKDINWNDIEHADYAAVYCGTDSEHGAFVASYGAETIKNPFEIYVLNVDGDNPVVIKKYVLPLGTDMWVQRVDVTGSLEAGNFTVTATLWNDLDLLSTRKTYIGVWKFNDGEMTSVKYVPENITVAKASCVADDVLLVQDGSSLEIKEAPVRAKQPTLLDISGDEVVEKSTIMPEEGDDELGNCFAILDVDDDYFMLYAHKGNPVAFKMVYLPNFPENFEGAKTVWTYEPGEEFSETLNNNTERHMTNIFVEKPDEDGTNIYLSANGKGMAKLTLKKDEISTGVENLVVSPADAPAEYFDITGRRLHEKPLTGFFIERRGTEATKHIAR